jgi:hypothetical protein
VLVVAHDAAALHGDDALPHRIHDTFIMRRDDDRGPEFVDLLQNLDDFVRIHRVEVTGRLVSDDNIRLVDDGAADGDALLFAAGKLMREMSAFIAKVDEIEDVRNVEPISSSVRPAASMAKAMFSYAVLFGMRRKSWKTMPIFRR